MRARAMVVVLVISALVFGLVFGPGVGRRAEAAEMAPLAAMNAGAGIGVPSARLPPSGTVGTTVTEYLDGGRALGLALSLDDRLSLSVDLDSGEPGRFPRPLPTADLRLGLGGQTRWIPALAAGIRAEATASHPEAYLAASRTVGRFDLHAGLRRPIDDGAASAPWRGLRAFGAIDMALPTRWPLWVYASRPPDPRPEASLPVDLGLIWRARRWLDLEAGLEGGDRAFLRGVLTYRADDWRVVEPDPPPPRAGPGPIGRAERAPASDAMLVDVARDAGLPVAGIERIAARLIVRLDSPDGVPVARTLGRAARLMARHAPAGVERFEMIPARGGLPGTAVTLYRRDVVLGAEGRLGPEEMWRRARPRPAPLDGPLPQPAGRRWWLTLSPRYEFDATAPEDGRLERWTIGFDGRLRPTARTLVGADLRLRLHDTLPFLRFARATPPVRSDPWAPVAGGTLERAFAAALVRPVPGVAIAGTAGLLERDYAGAAVSALWRPFASRWAVEAEATAGRLRLPVQGLAFTPETTWTARTGLRWSVPGTRIEATAGVDRFLAGDTGFDIGLQRRFDNGVAITADVTVSRDPQGIDPAVAGMLRVRVPLVSGLRNAEAAAELAIGPMLRDAGQRPRLPVDLAAITEPIGFAGLAGGWRTLFE
ncbi:MAG: YjbH domain-containing protein [Azospirillaceae bacterium]